MGVFGSSGTRGIVGEQLTPAFVERLAAVAATRWDADRVAIGRDSRITGHMLANAASSGVTSVGTDVERVGIVPTPALQDYLAHASIPGCMITASHNPPEYNGMKLFDADGVEVGGAALRDIEAAFEANRRKRATWDRIGNEVRVDGVNREYVARIEASLDVELIGEASLTVAVDPGHGAGIRTTPRLCRKLGCRVVGVNDTLDGRFPGRPPEPVPEALEDLCRLVRASDADLGIAHDGDADRAMFVDERGQVVSGDTTLAVLAMAVVDPGDTVVTAIDTSDRLADAVAERGGTLERTPIGSAQLVQRMIACRRRGDRIPLAGEANGGIFLPEHSLARDAAYALGKILELVCERPLGERADAHGGYHLVRREVGYASPAERDRMLAAVEAYGESTDSSMDRTDGIRLDFADGWVLARASGTEPLVRIAAEAEEPAIAEEQAARVDSVLRGA